MLRRTFTTGAAALCGVLFAGLAQAQDMRAPEGPIEFTVGSGAGGSPDVIMRTFAQIMNEQGIVENAIVVQNRSGGGHSNAYNHVLGLPGDENTLLTLASPVFTTPIVQGTPSVIDQITPIAALVQSELLLFTTPDSDLNSLADVVAAATAAPGRVRVAGGASGGNDHVLTGLIETATGITLTYVPHESGSAGRATFLGGNVELHFATVSEGLEMIGGGTGKPLAIFSAERRGEEALAGIPTAPNRASTSSTPSSGAWAAQPTSTRRSRRGGRTSSSRPPRPSSSRPGSPRTSFAATWSPWPRPESTSPPSSRPSGTC
jgi:putative tricarboxylic transport membrane protein